MRQYYSNYKKNDKDQERSISDTDYAKYNRGMLFLFSFLALYLVIPVGDIPLLGLSLSAPLLFLIALPIFLRPPEPWFGKYRLWFFLAVAIWLGIFISSVSNGLVSGGTKFNIGQLKTFLQFAYWLLVFIITTHFVGHEKIGERIAMTIAVGIFLLAVLRLGEAVFGGAIGFGATLRIMTQNSYGIQFSTFAPVLLSSVFFIRRPWLSTLAFVALVVVAALNGSRSSWVAILIATALFAWMYLRTQPHSSRILFVTLFIALFAGLGLMMAPLRVVSSVNERLASFQKLEEDKSFLIRQMMIQKGIGLFRQSPLIGVGINRWYRESTPLDIPWILSYYSQAYFDGRSAHNSYVLFLAETGLAGSIPLGILLAILAIRGYRAASNLAKQGQIWALGIYCGFIGMSIHLWSLAGLTGTTPWFMYGLVAAMIVLEPHLAKGVFANNANRIPLSRSRSI